jgi:hypothetical protein
MVGCFSRDHTFNSRSIPYRDIDQMSEMPHTQIKGRTLWIFCISLPGSILSTFTAACGYQMYDWCARVDRTDLRFAFLRLDGTSINLTKGARSNWRSDSELVRNLRREVASGVSTRCNSQGKRSILHGRLTPQAQVPS